ncbi:bifunctional ornithine acetyltransferase/N-acetylglutamate synthase [Massilibacterium senegalense]|uniref:bifunctional ornithine acetyltransferase/N-acetylglutamate synthase n=1 Tax=Massilibacterium senegalense TaxID=1632858 RepID=UPI00078066A2|nr:bifunctional ornithine acetyltransferase/N-acetylglutamate synthase [Massilibacterium senegalense]
MTTSKIKKLEKGTITSPKGFSASGTHIGLKKKKLDLAVLYSEAPATAAAVYTLNQVQAAPIAVTKEAIAKEEKIQAVVINSGNANACTGTQGIKDAKEMQQLTAELFHIPSHYVAVSSTGVIGQLMPMDVVQKGIQNVTLQEEDGGKNFATAILTTDTYTKTSAYQLELNGETITIAGVCKGSGMIHPNMATMLAFITTDANIEAAALKKALSEVTNQTFNCITVDGETSTNDMVLVLANGLASTHTLTETDENYSLFVEALRLVSEDLAKKIARDGEGATKLIEVTVKGAKTNKEAGIIAKKIAGSDLVKTAVYGKDANWGRIICAIGHSEQPINPDTVDIAIGPINMLAQSQPVVFDEEKASEYFEKNEKIEIFVDLHVGDGSQKAWGCDLTYDYVKINASYRT